MYEKLCGLIDPWKRMWAYLVGPIGTSAMVSGLEQSHYEETGKLVYAVRHCYGCMLSPVLCLSSWGVLQWSIKLPISTGLRVNGVCVHVLPGPPCMGLLACYIDRQKIKQKMHLHIAVKIPSFRIQK